MAQTLDDIAFEKIADHVLKRGIPQSELLHTISMNCHKDQALGVDVQLTLVKRGICDQPHARAFCQRRDLFDREGLVNQDLLCHKIYKHYSTRLQRGN
jgi:hypothetical protein